MMKLVSSQHDDVGHASALPLKNLFLFHPVKKPGELDLGELGLLEDVGLVERSLMALQEVVHLLFLLIKLWKGFALRQRLEQKECSCCKTEKTQAECNNQQPGGVALMHRAAAHVHAA